MVDPLDDFRDKIFPAQFGAMEALFSGDSVPYLEMWSDDEPVSLFGAWGSCTTGSSELHRVYRWVASRFSGCSDLRIEVDVVGISGDTAYTVGRERFTASVDGGPPTALAIRVTHVYRRGDDGWRIVHRHGDWAPADEIPAGEPG
ncbi:YybH family protein [Actinoplanes sp. NPDC049265]|uniref:YybH family protein n=1 Tax=Actinoplanes sp. NPDC049265 TaxID=3363902 RepID=UPI00371B80E8